MTLELSVFKARLILAIQSAYSDIGLVETEKGILDGRIASCFNDFLAEQCGALSKKN